MTTREQYITKLERLLISDFSQTVKDVIDGLTSSNTELCKRNNGPQAVQRVRYIDTGEICEVLDSYCAYSGRTVYLCKDNTGRSVIFLQHEVEQI